MYIGLIWVSLCGWIVGVVVHTVLSYAKGRAVADRALAWPAMIMGLGLLLAYGLLPDWEHRDYLFFSATFYVAGAGVLRETARLGMRIRELKAELDVFRGPFGRAG